MFITFEGVDGSGKSTQAKLLVEYLNSVGKKAVFTREPGGTEFAEKIRSLILAENIEDPLTEFLLICAARRDHVNKFIIPALDKGDIVVCDRFLDSSIMYQGYAKGLDVALIKKLHVLTVNGILPDMTFVLDVPHSIAANRIERLRTENNHYDSKGAQFFDKLRHALLDLANSEKRYKLINATGDLDSIHARIVEIFESI